MNNEKDYERIDIPEDIKAFFDKEIEEGRLDDNWARFRNALKEESNKDNQT